MHSWEHVANGLLLLPLLLRTSMDAAGLVTGLVLAYE